VDLPLPTERVDERDTMFARAERRAGTPQYEAYYAARPELKGVDDRLRAMPELLAPGGRHYDPVVCGEAGELFRAIDRVETDRALVARWSARLREGSAPAATVESIVLELGAVDVGCCTVEPAFVYSHKGRFDADFGYPIEVGLRHAVVFVVEMDFAAMRSAPEAEALRESARQYLRAAEVAHGLAAVLEAAGHRARPQFDAHYDVILPPLAVAAGLGELGRNNILVSRRWGSRVRIGAVTTDLELPPGRRVDLGVQHFCSVCKKCSDSCPSRALSGGEKERVRGVRKWPTDVERCYGYWRAVGTDCGVCMAVCPFSHRDNAFHAMVRWVVARAPWAHRLLRWGDDLVYGRGWKPRAG